MTSSAVSETAPLLVVDDLHTWFSQNGRLAPAVDGVSFTVHAGKTLCVVGESGCGKSVTALSVMGLVPSPPGRIVGGNIQLQGRVLTDLKERELRRMRGKDMAMIFQEPMSSLNPVMTVGAQVMEALELHLDLSPREAKARAVSLFKEVGIPAAEQRINEYPHQLSGGMKQRVMIAMALACEPSLLIADEPTTALDVTIQAQILDLLRSLQAAKGMGMLMITHDLGVVAEVADEVVVMYAGRVVERADVFRLFDAPAHPYTQGLFASLPSLDAPRGTRLETIEGMVPSPYAFPSGCRFRTRCRFATSACAETMPALRAVHEDQWVACHYAEAIAEGCHSENGPNHGPRRAVRTLNESGRAVPNLVGGPHEGATTEGVIHD